jgi:hypothetical protein
MNSSFASGQRGIIFTSGINDSIGNPSSAKQFGVYVAFSNGIVRELVKLVSQVQLIHNSADVSIDTIDVYINGKKVIDNFGFRDATPFIKYNALVPTIIINCVWMTSYYLYDRLWAHVSWGRKC